MYVWFVNEKFLGKILNQITFVGSQLNGFKYFYLTLINLILWSINH